MLFFCGHLYPRKVNRHMTSDFDVCEVDLDIFANELSKHCTIQETTCSLTVRILFFSDHPFPIFVPHSLSSIKDTYF